jgi:hypothetical protein
LFYDNHNIKIILFPEVEIRGVEKDHFNRRALKVFAKDTKLNHYKYVLCDLGEKP